ncbi:MAG TPA: AraC family transcriptional regulator [Bacillota bacterium]|nr:AraC family transcriptional regulator [Bacillota bacterium]HPT87435.1 AraC family transcriptional regulator [Bacillota bacterium]
MAVPDALVKIPNSFYISHRKMTTHHSRHVHDSFELLYLYSGERSFFINDRTFKIQAGDLCLIHPNVLHRATSEDSPECEGILLYFHESFLSPNQPLGELLSIDDVYVTLPIYERTVVEELFQKMLHDFETHESGFTLNLQGLTLQLLVLLGRCVKKHQTEQIHYPSPMHQKVSEIARYINHHYQEDLSLESLAHQFYISPSYLSKIFKRVTNFTFIEYLNNVRVKEAKRLLMETSKKVVEIAEEVGFGSITHFGRVFKEITGNPPAYYRKLKKHPENIHDH